MNHRKSVIFFLLSLSMSLSIECIDNPHFYRSTNMLFDEPRIEHDHLSSFDVTIGSGSTSQSINSSHQKTFLYNLYGGINATALALNVPSIDPTNQYETIVNDLAKIGHNGSFGNLSAGGTFSIIEANVSYVYNLAKGFLLLCHLPIRSLSTKHPFFIDLSPDGTATPNKKSPEWLLFLSSFDDVMNYYNIDTSPTTDKGLGDLSLLTGWTHNYQKTKTLDFIDITVIGGILFPTGKKRDENKLFSLPLGYNGHWGFPLNGMLSFGAYGWLTLGLYGHTILFAKNNSSLRVQTSSEQSGIIMLASETATIDKGAAWNTGLILKADHFMYGLSFITGYAYSGERKNRLSQSPHSALNTKKNLALHGWNMHTLHFNFEYDFTKENSIIGPRIGLFYNYQLGGTRVFQTNITGASLGLDIVWHF